MAVNARTEKFQHIEVFDKPALFTNGRIARDTVPKGWYCYDIRGSDDDPGELCYMEENVVVNHAGSVLMPEKLAMPKSGRLDVRDELGFLDEGNMTLREFCEAHQLPCPAENMKFHIRPARPEEAGLFYTPHPEEDKRLGAVGHVRMDFGRSGNEFWHTWWPRGPEELNSPAFKAELQEVVDTLRESVLKNRFAMERFCYEHGGKISGGWTQNYGYIVETEHYRYCLRCNPSPGDYNGYIGDSLWQKTYTTEAIPTVRHRNTGACEQYYVEGTHPPIISKEVFTKVQILIQMRKENYGKSPSETIHPLSRKAICGCCGTVLRRKPQRGKYYWCCMRHDTNREECPLMPISETSLCESFCRLYYKLKHQSIPILEQMLTNLQMIRNRRMLWSPDIVALNKRISDLSSQNQTLAFLKQQGLVDPDIFIAKTNELTKQLRQAKLEKEKLMDAESDMTALQTRDLIDLLEGGPEFLDSFDAELFGELVEKIIIESNDSVRFCLKNGLELRESIERTVR